MKVLKFIGLLFGMMIVTDCVPFGEWVCVAVCMVALWKLVND